MDRTLLDPALNERLDRLTELLAAEGLAIRFVSGRRTCAEQNRLYAQGRSEPGQIITHARGCVSWHVAGRAVDFDFGHPWSTGHRPTEGDYAHVGALWESLGGVWGGHFAGFVDLPHLEYHPGLRIGDVCPNPDACRDGQSYGGGGPGPMSIAPSPPPYGAAFAVLAVLGLGYVAWRART